MSEELNPCPFCGKMPIVQNEMGNDWAVCKTLACCAFSDSFLLWDWNTRPLEDSLRKQLEDCKKLLGEQGMETINQSSKNLVIRDQLGVAMKALDYYATHLIEGGRVAVEAQAKIAKIGETK